MVSKRWAKRVGLGCVVAIVLAAGVLVGARAWRRSMSNREWAAAVAETEQRDPQWRWEALNAARTAPPPGRNGADLIPEIQRLTPPQCFGKLLADWPGYDWPPPVNARYPAPVIDEARRQLAAAASAVALARKLKDYPTGRREVVLRPDVLLTCPRETNDTRTAVALLKWDVVLAVEDGDTGWAADSLLALLNACRSIGDEPTLLSQIVRNNVRGGATRSLEWVLAQTELPDARLTAIQAAWAADAEEPLLLYGLRGERAMMDRLFEKLMDGSLDLADYVGGPKKTGADRVEQDFDRWQYRSGMGKDRAFALRWYTGAVAAARLPAEQQSAALAGLTVIDDGDGEKLREHRLSAGHLYLSGRQAATFWRGTAEMRCAAVAVACERYRLKHGRWPADLTELPRDLLPAIPADPFDGKPLRYKRLPDGVAIYSVGANLSDEGGQFSRGYGNTDTDYGFRLWSPEHRRRPAPEPRPEPPLPDQPEPEEKP